MGNGLHLKGRHRPRLMQSFTLILRVFRIPTHLVGGSFFSVRAHTFVKKERQKWNFHQKNKWQRAYAFFPSGDRLQNSCRTGRNPFHQQASYTNYQSNYSSHVNVHVRHMLPFQAGVKAGPGQLPLGSCFLAAYKMMKDGPRDWLLSPPALLFPVFVHVHPAHLLRQVGGLHQPHEIRTGVPLIGNGLHVGKA